MNMTVEHRQAFWIRVLLVACAVLAFLAVVQFRALRLARHDIQILRAEREQVKAGASAVWAHQAADEFVTAVRWLQDFYADSGGGLGRAQGICAGGEPDAQAIATWVLGEFVPARAAGQPVAGAIGRMEQALRQSAAYRDLHPR